MSAIRRTLTLSCSCAHAFRVFTERMDAWWPPSHRKHPNARMLIEPRVGGRFYERAPSGEEVERGEVLAWDPPHALRYSWWPGSSDAPTEVAVTFRAEGDRTIVEVTHTPGSSDAASWPKRAERFIGGWSAVLPAFADAVEQREEDA